MLSTTNIAKSDCLTNFKHSNKAILRWCGLGLWWLVLRSVREGHHPLQIHPSPVMFFRKKTLKKTMLQDLRWFLELTLHMEPLHSKKVRCASHDTSHILNNPIITSQKTSESPHAFKRHCKIRLPVWDDVDYIVCGVLCLDPYWKVSRICWHTILCKVFQSKKLAKCGMILRNDTVV